MKIFNFNTQEDSETCEKYVPKRCPRCLQETISSSPSSCGVRCTHLYYIRYYCNNCGKYLYTENPCNSFESGYIVNIVTNEKGCKTKGTKAGFSGTYTDIGSYSGRLIHCGDNPVAITICQCNNPHTLETSNGTITWPSKTYCSTLKIAPGPHTDYSNEIRDTSGYWPDDQTRILGPGVILRANSSVSSCPGYCCKSDRFNISIIKVDMKLKPSVTPGCRKNTGDRYTGNKFDYTVPEEASCTNACGAISGACSGTGPSLKIEGSLNIFPEHRNPEWHQDFSSNIK